MAKKKKKRTWGWAPRKPTPPPVPDDLKAEVEAKANELIKTFLKPTYVKRPPKDKRLELPDRHLDQMAPLILLFRQRIRQPRPECHRSVLRVEVCPHGVCR